MDNPLEAEKFLNRQRLDFLETLRPADPFAEFCRLNREREPFYLKFADLVWPVDREIPAPAAAGALAEKLEQEWNIL